VRRCPRLRARYKPVGGAGPKKLARCHDVDVGGATRGSVGPDRAAVCRSDPADICERTGQAERAAEPTRHSAPGDRARGARPAEGTADSSLLFPKARGVELDCDEGFGERDGLIAQFLVSGGEIGAAAKESSWASVQSGRGRWSCAGDEAVCRRRVAAVRGTHTNGPGGAGYASPARMAWSCATRPVWGACQHCAPAQRSRCEHVGADSDPPPEVAACARWSHGVADRRAGKCRSSASGSAHDAPPTTERSLDRSSTLDRQRKVCTSASARRRHESSMRQIVRPLDEVATRSCIPRGVRSAAHRHDPTWNRRAGGVAVAGWVCRRYANARVPGRRCVRPIGRRTCRYAADTPSARPGGDTTR
jgi:hypothetical protein